MINRIIVQNDPINWRDPEGLFAVSGSAVVGACAANLAACAGATAAGGYLICRALGGCSTDAIPRDYSSRKEHTKNKQKKNHDKHTKKRAGDKEKGDTRREWPPKKKGGKKQCKRK